ncbi:MAG: hypothetical protein XD72_2207, partial [Methanothrix harundinacea]
MPSISKTLLVMSHPILDRGGLHPPGGA